MTETSLAKKLRIQPGQRIVIMNPPPGYMDELGELPEGVELADTFDGTFDFVHLFAKDAAELERLGPTALHIIKHDGILWISYPKKSSTVETDLSQDLGWDLLADAGLRPVTQVSINNVWSALRFRPADLVGK